MKQGADTPPFEENSCNTPLMQNLNASHFEPTLSLVDAALYEWDIADDSLHWSGNAASVLGLRNINSLARGADWEALVDTEAMGTRQTVIMGASQRDNGSGIPYDLEYPIQLNTPDGPREIWIEDVGRWFANSEGRPCFARGMIRVVTNRHHTEQRLFIESRIDPLTGTFNRLRLLTILESTLDEAKRYQTSFGVALIAIENVSALNQTYGVDVTDEVIAGLGKRLRLQMRAGDILGRFSSTVFGILLANCEADALEVACKRFLHAVYENPIAVNHGNIPVLVTIAGIVMPRYARTVPEALSRLNDVLSEARSQHCGGFLSYTPELSRTNERQDNLKLAEELLNALNDRRIALAYQPIVDTQTGNIGWHESLARIVDGQGVASDGVANYIQAAEKLGMVHLLDRRVLELAVQKLDTTPDLHLAINISALTTRDPEWRSMLSAAIAAHPHIAPRLMIEITETMALGDSKDATHFITFLHTLGLKVAVDDFGAGHTSFRNLRGLDVDVVKIDGSFIKGAIQSPQDRAFVRAIVSLASEMGYKTVAECIETPESHALMREMGIHYIQGHLSGKPQAEPLKAPQKEQTTSFLHYFARG